VLPSAGAPKAGRVRASLFGQRAVELALGILAVPHRRGIDGDGDTFVLDQFQLLFVTQESRPGSAAGASGPSQGLTVADPEQDWLAFGRSLLPRLPEAPHPR